MDTQAPVKVCLCGLMDPGGAWIDEDGLRQEWEGAALLQSAGVANLSTTPRIPFRTAAGRYTHANAFVNDQTCKLRAS